jgi:hypothetical protein
MVMTGHAQRLAQPLTRGQRRIIAVVVAALVGVSAWLIVAQHGVPASRNGCVNVVVASSMGGGLLQHCGAAARTWCQTEFAHNDALALRVQEQCRAAGLRPRQR